MVQSLKSAKHVQILQKLTQIQMLKLPKCQKNIKLKNKLLKQFKKYMIIQKRNIRKRKNNTQTHKVISFKF